MSTPAYAPPSIGPQGLTIPSYGSILADVLQDFLNIFGQTNYLGIDTADYQFNAAICLKLGDNSNTLELVYNGQSPTTAVGAHLDAIVKLNGLTRNQSSYSTVTLTITGTAGAVITSGVVQDLNSNNWNLPGTVTIGSGGTIIVTATAQNPGVIDAVTGSVSIIATPTSGWASVTNALPATAGTAFETDSQLRARQAISVAGPGMTQLASVAAAVAAVPGRTRSVAYENQTGAASTDPNGFNLPAHSITVVAEGGTDLAVGTAIYSKRGIGALMNGTTTVNVVDPNNNNASTSVSFYRPSYVPIFVSLSIHQIAGYTTATTTLIQTAIATYLNSLQIGEEVTLSALNAVALSVMPSLIYPQFSVRALTAGIAASPTGTADITFLFNQAAQGMTANVVISFV